MTRPAPLDWNRILSGGIAAAWLTLAAIAGGVVAVLQSTMALALPLVCIWFPDILGGMTSSLPGLGNAAISRESPGCAVRALGWVALLALTLLQPILYFALRP
jgi:hypothetical protein